MATNDNPTKCRQCKMDFNETERCPRIFKCFHTFCHDCIGQLIKRNTKRCPTCNKKFKASNAADIMINHTLLELIKYIPSQDTTSTNSLNASVRKPAALSSRHERILELKEETKSISMKHLAACSELQTHIEQTISKISQSQEVLELTNNRIESEVLPKINNIIIANNRVYEEFTQIKTQLHDQLKTLKEKSKQLQNTRIVLESCSTDTFMKIAVLVDKAEETNTAVHGWVVDCKKAVTMKDKDRQVGDKEVQRSSKDVDLVLDILKTRGDTEEKITSHMTRALSINKELQLITRAALREMNNPLRKLVKEGNLYAIQQHIGRRRIAKISIDDKNNLCIHHLRDEQQPPNACFILHSDVMELVDTHSRLAFLDLASQGITLVRLYIRLTPDTKRAQNFSLLCTAEMGPSYVNTKVLGMDNKGSNTECIWCGDYESNDGSKGMALVPDSGVEVGGLYARPWLPGSLEGGWEYRQDDKAAQFLVYTNRNPGVMLDAAFGLIEDGLRALKDIVSNISNVCELTIKDSGLVLFNPLPSESMA